MDAASRTVVERVSVGETDTRDGAVLVGPDGRRAFLGLRAADRVAVATSKRRLSAGGSQIGIRMAGSYTSHLTVRPRLTGALFAMSPFAVLGDAGGDAPRLRRAVSAGGEAGGAV